LNAAMYTEESIKIKKGHTIREDVPDVCVKLKSKSDRAVQTKDFSGRIKNFGK